jgi:predicted dehydrogenase
LEETQISAKDGSFPMNTTTKVKRREFLIGSTLALGGVCLGATGAGGPLKVGILGLKHGHGLGMLQAAAGDPRVTIVALAEDDEKNRQSGEKIAKKPVKYANYRELLSSPDGQQIDAVLVCEEFGRRGEAAIAALEMGKHVFSDKPLCTRVEELQKIATLAAQKHLEVHVDFALRHNWAKAGNTLQQGAIGEIVSCTFSGPHTLNYEKRPKWFFNPELNGGIINDLLGHGVDFASWATGKPFTQVFSATRAFVGCPEAPTFETSGDAFYQLAGGATAFGHVDYLSPVGHPGGWKCTFVGSKGDAMVSDHEGFVARLSGAAEVRLTGKELRGEAASPLKDFVSLLTEGKAPLRSTAESLHGALATLVAQAAAVNGGSRVALPGLKAG